MVTESLTEPLKAIIKPVKGDLKGVPRRVGDGIAKKPSPVVSGVSKLAL
jgi:hypothetical protein